MREGVAFGSFYVDASNDFQLPVTCLVILARHAAHAEIGRRLSGRSEIELSETGRRTAAQLGERLRDAGLTLIHSSPRRRALETATPVATQCGIAVETAAALDEIDFGEWTGRAFDALDADPTWQRWNSARGSVTPPGGESMADATARAIGHVEAVARRTSGPALLVTHCDIIRGIVAHYLGLALDRLLSFDIDLASRTTLAVGGRGGRVVTVNERL